MIRQVLRMGDPRLLQRSQELKEFGTPELYALLADMRDTMAQLNGAGPVSYTHLTLPTN